MAEKKTKQRVKGNRKAAILGMDVLHWFIETVKNGPELWQEYKMVADPESGATVRKDCRKLRDLSLGVVGCDTSRELYRIARHLAPAGVVLEDYEPTRWENSFQDFRALVRMELTKAMLTEDNSKKAKLLLDVLERRDEHYAKKDSGKQVSVTQTDSENKTTSITFKVVDGN